MSRRLLLVGIVAVSVVAGIVLISRPNPATNPDLSPTSSVDGAANPQNGAAEDSFADGKYMVMPKRFQFPGVDNVATYSDDKAMLSSYTPQQRSLIEAYYGRYGGGMGGADAYAVRGVFSFRNKEQLAWLVSQGYPMPDEIIAATKSSDEDLRRLAREGNLKAGAFYLERVSAAQERMISEGRLNPLDRIRGQELAETAEIEAKVLASGSPFGGYVLAQRGMDANRGSQVLAGYAFASDLGDTRASDFVMAYSRAHPEISGAEAIAAYRAAVTTAALRNPQLSNRSTLARRPRFPRFGSE